MKYHILGPRVLIKVVKPTFEEFLKENQLVKGSNIIHSVNTKTKEELEDAYQIKVATQTKGTVEDVGGGVADLEGCANLSKGATVHFQRYGAVRLNTNVEDTMEYWIVNGKDLLCVEEA